VPYRVRLTPEAQDHLEQLEDYISEASSPRIAANYIERLRNALNSLALSPFRGTKREEFGAGLRTTGFEHRITILFAVRNDEVIIVGIFYGGRSFEPAR
jgi:toxin ParE1/3/4